MAGRGWGSGRTPMRDPLDFVSGEQFRQVYEYAVEVGLEREALLIRTAFESGRRICEIVGQPAYSTNGVRGVRHHVSISGLRPMDIDAQAGKLVFTIAKKGQIERPKKAFDATPKLCALLLDYAAKYRIKPEQRLFPISTSRVRQIIPKLFMDAGVLMLGEKQPHMHALRHGAVIDGMKKADKPEDILVIHRQLDHSSLDLTLYYMQYRTDSAARHLLAKRFELDKGTSDIPKGSFAPPTNSSSLSPSQPAPQSVQPSQPGPVEEPKIALSSLEELRRRQSLEKK